jgi:hypothetical protein
MKGQLRLKINLFPYMKIFTLSMQKAMLLAEMRKHQLTFVKIYKMRPVIKTILAKMRKMGLKSLMKTCHAHSCPPIALDDFLVKIKKK